MGWFWADNAAQAAPAKRVAPHPLPHSGATLPPGCPMHEASSIPAPPKAPSTPAGACPYTPPDNSSATPHSSSSKTLTTLQKLNPLNYMPSDLSQSREFSNQTVSLPTSREPSSIPRGDDTGTNWEYPSPQQMYNAMLRKGYTDTPAEHVESMVAVHNFLNEGAWSEIVEWERRFGAGLGRGWSACARGEDGSKHGAALGNEWKEEDRPQPTLVRLMGRPNEMTPKASLLQMLGWAWPGKYGTAPPFDRHDWFVSRCDKEGRCKEVRYVIDYYEGPEEASGEPVFFLDVRPAVDGPTHACERLLRWGGDVWWRASGGVARGQNMKW